MLFTALVLRPMGITSLLALYILDYKKIVVVEFRSNIFGRFGKRRERIVKRTRKKSWWPSNNIWMSKNVLNSGTRSGLPIYLVSCSPIAFAVFFRTKYDKIIHAKENGTQLCLTQD